MSKLEQLKSRLENLTGRSENEQIDYEELKKIRNLANEVAERNAKGRAFRITQPGAGTFDVIKAEFVRPAGPDRVPQSSVVTITPMASSFDQNFMGYEIEVKQLEDNRVENRIAERGEGLSELRNQLDKILSRI